MRLARSPYPLPFAGLRGKRSLLSVQNLVGAIAAVLTLPFSLQRPFIVADPEPLSVAEMVTALRRGLGRRAGLVPVPPKLLALGLAVLGRGEIYQRLAGSLVADPSALMKLGWTPQLMTRDALAALARATGDTSSV